MSDKNDKPLSNGTSSGIDPLQRLSSFKPPRDLSLGASKTNKKVFTPNLNVSRNKNKSGPAPNLRETKKDHDRGKRDRKNDRNKNQKFGPQIIKSSGVFSEGMGAAERHSSRTSYGRDTEAAPTLQKPTIRVKDVWKIDKELEEQKIKKVFDDAGDVSDDENVPEDCKAKFDKDAPVKLPICDGGWLHSKPKIAIKAKQEVVVKQEPADVDVDSLSEKKPQLGLRQEVHEETDLVTLLRGDKPALLMIQFPDSLPGQCAGADDNAPRRQPTNQSEQKPDENTQQEKPVENRCHLKHLEEGKIGRLLIHRSGKVRLALGDTMFEVSAGTSPWFQQEAVSIGVDSSSRSANLVSLGSLQHKLNILPHWESMLPLVNN